MQKSIYWVHFKDTYDVDAVDEIVWDFAEADHYYDDKEVRFYGTSERLQEFLRAIQTVENIDYVI